MNGTQRDARAEGRPADLSGLPDDARVWCFGAYRALEPGESERLLAAVRDFLQGWAAHGQPLLAGANFLHGRFLVVGLDESWAAASGCSIDALVRRLRELEDVLAVGVLDASPVWYRDPGGAIRRTDRAAFAERAGEGRVTGETPVFDLTVERLGEVRAGRLEAPAARTWHRALLPEGAGVAGGGTGD